MKLATFEVNGEEKWGFLAVNPRTEQECIVVPHDVEAVIPALCRYTSYFELSKPCFIGEGKEWPKDLQGFLEMGEPAWNCFARWSALSMIMRGSRICF